MDSIIGLYNFYEAIVVSPISPNKSISPTLHTIYLNPLTGYLGFNISHRWIY